jgi:Flp pilus assembly protein TadB
MNFVVLVFTSQKKKEKKGEERYRKSTKEERGKVQEKYERRKRKRRKRNRTRENAERKNEKVQGKVEGMVDTPFFLTMIRMVGEWWTEMPGHWSLLSFSIIDHTLVPVGVMKSTMVSTTHLFPVYS